MKKGIDYIGIGVGIAILNEEGKLLIGLRGEEASSERGTWEIPGGSVEFGETLEQAVKREAQEEMGIEVEIIKLLGICDHIIAEEKQHWVAPTYLCKITKGVPEIREPHKCAAMGWFSLEEAEKLPLSVATKHDIGLLIKRQEKKDVFQ